MKYILLLSLVFSCSTKKNDSGALSHNPGESDSRPVSPYTVRPCYCMKIFKPVCADGITYGNSCEAECHGHKTWTEGPCKKESKNK